MKIFLLIISLLATGSALRSNAQIITTIAGNGTSGYSGDGFAATLAQLESTDGVYVDGAGNVYVADHINNRIRKIDVSGIISTFAGDGSTTYNGEGIPATTASLQIPIDIVKELSGNTYIIDRGHYRIRKVDPAGVISCIAGIGAFGYSGDGGPATNANINISQEIDVDGAGNIYFCDGANRRVRRVSVSGIITTIAGNGTLGYSGDGGPATSAEMNPYGIAIDGPGNIYVSDRNSHVIRKINPAGIISTFAGNGTSGFSGDGGPATAALLNGPSGIDCDAAGNLYITDYLNYRIRKIDAATGIISTIAGNGTTGYSGDGGNALSAQFAFLDGISIDVSGNIYVSDRTNYVVRKITMYSPPSYTKPAHQILTICNDTIAIDTLLTAMDANAGLTIIWSIGMAPLHGYLSTTYATPSTGGAVTPSGLYYVPTAGYSGVDSFSVVVSNAAHNDTTIVVVTIDTAVHTGSISGADSLCPGATLALTATTAGGTWQMTNTKATVSTTGTVTGITPGLDTVMYIVTNGCGSDTTTKIILVKNFGGACPSNTPHMAIAFQSLTVYPNPNAGSFFLKLNTLISEPVTYTITNLIGGQVGSYQTVSNMSKEIKLNLPPGLYIATATTTGGSINAKLAIH